MCNRGNVVQDELHYPWGQEWTMVGTLDEERFLCLHGDAGSLARVVVDGTIR
ncbi:MAG: hypothetical protein ACRD2B_10150 [Terriglobia bacterium]